MTLLLGGKDGEKAMDALEEVIRANDIDANFIDCRAYPELCNKYEVPTIVLPYRHLIHQLLPPECLYPDEIE